MKKYNNIFDQAFQIRPYYTVTISYAIFFILVFFSSSNIAKSEVNNTLQPIEINELELAQMRGRFASSGRVIYFGVTMRTTWETDVFEKYSVSLDAGFSMEDPFDKNTTRITSRMSIESDGENESRMVEHRNSSSNRFSKLTKTNNKREKSQTYSKAKHNKKVQITDIFAKSSLSSVDFSGDDSSSHRTTKKNASVSNIQAVKNSTGIVQRIHVEGNKNEVRNSINLDIASADDTTIEEFQYKNSAPVLDAVVIQDVVEPHVEKTTESFPGISYQENNDSPLSNAVYDHPTEITNSNKMVTSSGVILTTGVTENNLNVSIDIPNYGRVVQQLSSHSGEMIRGILQQVNLVTNEQKIHNTLDFHALIQRQSGFSSSSIRSSLRALIDLQIIR